VIVTLGPWASLGAFDATTDPPWAITRDHGARNTRSSFGQQSLWCWSSWRSPCGAGGRDGSKIAPGASRRSARNAGDRYAEQSEPNQTERGFRVVEHS
jgi:hypothetical protein